MPTPNLDDETRKEWIIRCVPIVIADGTTDRPDQAVAICNSMWDQSKRKRREDRI